jgi:hypothetical protein
VSSCQAGLWPTSIYSLRESPAIVDGRRLVSSRAGALPYARGWRRLATVGVGQPGARRGQIGVRTLPRGSTQPAALGRHDQPMAAPDDAVARPTAHYPPAEITAAGFERFVTSLFNALEKDGAITNLRIQNHEVIRCVDGEYNFDATRRYELAGMAFLTLVEAKMHKNPIKRETVKVLHQKLLSVGAHKAVLVSTAPFQAGALAFAVTHGIALVTVTEGRFTYESCCPAPAAYARAGPR